MQFVILTVGSIGDVLPLATLGRTLKTRGHRVTLLAHVVHEQVAEQNGLEFVALSGEEEYRRSNQEKRLLATRYFWLFLLRHSVSWNQVIFRAIRRFASPDLRLLAVDRPNLWADLTANAHLGIPLIRVLTDLPVAPATVGLTQGVPWGNVQRLLAARAEAAWSAVAAKEGLSVGRHQIVRMMRSSQWVVPRIALWPDWIASGMGKRWASHVFGFVPPQGVSPEGWGPAVENRGQRRRVVFVAGTAGTTGGWVNRFYDVSRRVCQVLGCDGLLLGAEGVDERPPTPGFVVRRSFRPLAEVLPGASAIVHHGGIGTAATAMKCGVPQLIIPRVFAQPFNAEWLRRLGVCMVLEARSYTVQMGVKCIGELMGQECYRTRSVELAQRSDYYADLNRICGFLEDWGGRPSAKWPFKVDRVRPATDL